MASGEERRLIDDIGQVGADEPRCPCRERADINGGRQLDLLGVELENFFPSFHIRTVDQHLAVETTGPQQCRVENFRPVRRCHHDHILVRIEAVHFGEQLIERLLALIMTAQHIDPPRFTERIELVDEDDARRMRCSLSEQIADPRGAHSHEHLHELCARHLEERHPSLTRDSPREKRLARPRRAHEQHALRDLRSQPDELVRVLQKVDDFDRLLERLIDARYVVEADPGTFLTDDPGATLPHGQHPLRRIHPPQHPEPEKQDDEER